MDQRAVNDETVAGVLRLALLVIVVASAAALAAGIATGLPETISVAGTSLLLNGSLLILLRRGKVSWVAVGTPLSVLLVATGGLLVGQGVHDEALVLFPLVLVLSNLVGDRRWSYGLMGLAVVIPVGVGAAELTGLVRTPASHLTAPGEVFVLGLILLANGAIIRRFMDLLLESLHRAHKSERSYREVFDSTSDALFVHHPETGQILDVNRTMLDLYGLERHEALAGTPLQLSASDNLSGAEEALARIHAAARGESCTFEWHARKKSGETFWVEVALKRAVIGGEPRVLAVVRDISARREAEARLRQAEKMQAVGQLAGGIAHDFNNQLTGILGSADLLAQRLGHEPQLQELAELIIRSAGHSAELTQQLLAFARKGTYRQEPVELNALVRDVLQLVGRSMDKAIQLTERLHPEPVTTLGDPALLQNAILNLVLNARDAMPEGGPLSVSTSVGEAPVVEGSSLSAGSWARVEVRDAGGGLSSEVRAKVFEPFFTTKSKGTGMGLAAVYGTARAHGGGVAIESRPGKGACFTLCLPFVAAEVAEAGREPAEESPPGDTTGPADRARRALVADDEPSVARVTRRVLESEGWEVLVCTDGEEAVREHAARAGTLDLVILDFSMPGLTGAAALEQIWARDPELPALLMTGYGDEALAAELGEVSRPIEVLAKPFVRAQLLAAVAGVCDPSCPD